MMLEGGVLWELQANGVSFVFGALRDTQEHLQNYGASEILDSALADREHIACFHTKCQKHY